MAEKTIPAVQTQSDEKPLVNREMTRTPELYVTPLTDIYETADALTVISDLPGVEKDGLEVKVENGILTIEGRMNVKMPGEPILKEFEPVIFFRQFELSEIIDQEKIGAELKHGVLRVTLPKAESKKPRQ